MLDKLLDFIGGSMKDIEVEEIKSTNTFIGSSGVTPLQRTIKKGIYIVQGYTAFGTDKPNIVINSSILEGGNTIATTKGTMAAGGGQTVTAIIKAENDDTLLRYSLYGYTGENLTATNVIRILKIK